MLIAIDGPAGAGKSTVARALARELRFSYLDSGALYRAVALRALAEPARDPAALARDARIELLGTRSEEPERVLLDGRDVTQQIRAPAVSEATSVLAANPAVREALLAKQRALLAHGDWVAEGRDIGTVVAPHAQLKVFLTASEAERAHRRAAQLGAAADDVLAEQSARDQRDSTRAHAPLRAAPDAVTLDTSQLTVQQVVERLAALARRA